MASARRIKQQLFEERKQKELEESKSDLIPNEKRQLVIYTWGASLRKLCPKQTQHNFNVCGISYRKNCTGVDLRKMTGMDDELKMKVESSPRFEMYISSNINVVERDDLTIISVNCRKGRHRSVSVANILKDKYYPNSKVIHLELNKTY